MKLYIKCKKHLQILPITLDNAIKEITEIFFDTPSPFLQSFKAPNSEKSTYFLYVNTESVCVLYKCVEMFREPGCFCKNSDDMGIIKIAQNTSNEVSSTFLEGNFLYHSTSFTCWKTSFFDKVSKELGKRFQVTDTSYPRSKHVCRKFKLYSR